MIDWGVTNSPIHRSLVGYVLLGCFDILIDHPKRSSAGIMHLKDFNDVFSRTLVGVG
jgi:hypothetical protein